MRLSVVAALLLPRCVDGLFRRLDQRDQIPRIARELRPRAAVYCEGAFIVQAANDHDRVAVSRYETVYEPTAVGRDDIVLDAIPRVEIRVVQRSFFLSCRRTGSEGQE